MSQPDGACDEPAAPRLDLRGYVAVSNPRAVLDLVVHWGGIAVLFGVAHVANHWAVYLACAFLIAGFQNGLATLAHEAVHSKFCRPRWLNHFFGAWLFGYPVGLTYYHDIARHRMHHRLLGSVEDPDRVNYAGPQWSTAGDVARFILGRFFGTLLLKNLVSIARDGRQPIFVEESSHAARPVRELASVAAVQLVLLGIAVACGRWWEYVVLWIYPLATFASAMIGTRAFLEHTNIDEDAGAEGRLFDFAPGLLGRFFISPSHFHLHALHHAYPAVPHYRLEALKSVLRGPDGGLGYPGSQRPDYLRALIEHLRVMRRHEHTVSSRT